MKCFSCATASIKHSFSICMAADCSCPCINEIYRMYKNNRQDDIKLVHPKFLKVDNEEVKELPSVDKEIAKFNRVDKKEWVKKKKDKRFKRKKR